ncbi:hypothetical protein [Zeimonas arvi]|uniref:Uncharacterized protein n=1 Tax=Zeimonas arvi TaxID=2498847 RepID=A0A5C8NP58_9BURK|nr:hypothetical protein [Zeimonas arvi]TXL63564.1 hypothetical protein FHP08_17160 [Zeimonas arvi]
MAKFTYVEPAFVDGKLIEPGTTVESPTQPASTVSAGEAASLPKAVKIAAGQSGDFVRNRTLADNSAQRDSNRSTHDKAGASHDPSGGNAYAVRPRWSAAGGL